MGQYKDPYKPIWGSRQVWGTEDSMEPHWKLAVGNDVYGSPGTIPRHECCSFWFPLGKNVNMQWESTEKNMKKTRQA